MPRPVLNNKYLPPEAMSADGYIIKQDCFTDYQYRTMPASGNGCGFMACYNLRHFLGHDVDFNDVRIELDSMMPQFRGPTYMRTMRKYLNRYVPNYREYHGKSECLMQAKRSSAGIFRYYEEMIPHFVTYIRAESGKFRFFNVNDGLEDFESDMDEFGRKHMVFGPVSLLCVNTRSDKKGS
ncbi:MAG: hypothetical protein II971_02290 [Firmicutes bacterium]|nr:hypothetical protein [Bacillota bacterium]